MFLIRLTDRVAKFLMILAAGWAFVLAFIILADIIGRSPLFNAPLAGVREIVANSIVMIVFLQAGYAIRSRSMLRADFLVARFNPFFNASHWPFPIFSGRRFSQSSSPAAGIWLSNLGYWANMRAKAHYACRRGRPDS